MPLEGLCGCHACQAKREVLEAVDASCVPKLLANVTEAAVALALSETTIRELIQSGELPSKRIGTAIRVPIAALREFARGESREKRGLDSAAV